MFRRLLLAAILFVGCDRSKPAAQNQPPPPSSKGKPNVVLIIVDDLNTALACYGHPDARTPHLDRLAARGILFNRAFCQFPVCNPSRTSMLSGLLPEKAGVMGNGGNYQPRPGQPPLLPRYLKDHGYQTIRVGKIFHDARRVLSGKPIRSTDDPGGWEISDDEPFDPDDTEEGGNKAVDSEVALTKPTQILDLPDEKVGDGIVVRRAAKLLEEKRTPDRAFFLAVGLRRPHLPWNAPKRYFDLYEPQSLKPAIDSREQLASILPIAVSKFFRPEPQPPAEAQRDLHAYLACVSFMDAQVGHLLGELDRLKLADDTLVVFTSDHGFHLGEHGLWSKNTLFEESARVPLIVAGPGVARGRTDRIVELLDVYPTLAEFCGLNAPQGLAGQSLLPLLKDPAAPRDGLAVTVLRREQTVGRSVRTDRHRYTEWGDNGSAGVELYDHSTDPRELKNLAADPGSQAMRQELATILRRALQR